MVEKDGARMVVRRGHRRKMLMGMLSGSMVKVTSFKTTQSRNNCFPMVLRVEGSTTEVNEVHSINVSSARVEPVSGGSTTEIKDVHL